jgi:hypothetical protein
MKTMAIVMILALVGCVSEVVDEMPADALEDAGQADNDAGDALAELDAGYDWPDGEADAGEDAGVCVLYCATTGGAEWCYAAGLAPSAYPAGIRCTEWE